MMDGKAWFDIVEMYDKPTGWTEDSMAPGGETKNDLITDLEMMLHDAKKYPVFIEEDPS